MLLKFELLVQVSPAFVLGLYWERLSARPLFIGMLAGGLTLFSFDSLYGVGGGLLGLLLNLGICVVGSLLMPASREETAHARRASALPAYADQSTA